jgi:hypothetical protein
MPIDIRFFLQFYKSRLGQMVAEDLSQVYQRLIDRQNKDNKNNALVDRTLAIGHIAPLLKTIKHGKYICFASLSKQGVSACPNSENNKALLVKENRLPFRNNFFDHVIMMHALEFAQDVEDFLKEVLRVTTESAQITIICPNRLGIWANNDKNPFGYGHPYTIFQLTDLLKANGLTVTSKTYGLRFLPSDIKCTIAIKHIWPKPFAGVLCINAVRDTLIPVPQKKSAFVYKPAFCGEYR